MKLLRLKTENLLALLYIPVAILNTTKADAGFLIIAIVMHFILLAGVYYGIRETRHELIADIKAGLYEEELEEIKEAIASFRRVKNTIANTFKNIKKEVIRSELKTTKLKDAF